jgi:hypothetical protein
MCHDMPVSGIEMEKSMPAIEFIHTPNERRLFGAFMVSYLCQFVGSSRFIVIYLMVKILNMTNPT